MIRISALVLSCFLIVLFAISCKKKVSGVCYCSYLSGDKKEFDLKSLDRSKQIDSCYVLNNNASAFAGSCKLE